MLALAVDLERNICSQRCAYSRTGPIEFANDVEATNVTYIMDFNLDRNK